MAKDSKNAPTTRVTEASPDTRREPTSPNPRTSEDSNPEMDQRQKNRLSRPTLGSRKSSGTIIIPRESPAVEIREESYEPDDARAMSPRRSSVEIDKMGDDARAALEQYALLFCLESRSMWPGLTCNRTANVLQTNLLEIIERVDSVKSEHEKLEGGNKFLQSYIGELMSTPKINPATGSKPTKAKKGRSAK